MLKVTGLGDCSGAVVERDPWIPLTVTWSPWPETLPLYLRISGKLGGGDIELKLDRHTGALLQIVVIDPPSEVAPTMRAGSHLRERKGRPLLEISQWTEGLSTDSLRSDLKMIVIREAMEIGYWYTGSEAGVVFENRMAAETITCGVARAGSTHDGLLANIAAGIS